jgi:hypothetical protein
MTLRTGGVQFAWIAIFGYIAMLVAVVWSLASARESAFRHLATQESIDDWKSWREDVRQQQSEPGPVSRRVPKSAEPPGLVLMRDYYVVCLTGGLVFTSLLYWVLAWFLRGMLRPSHLHQPEASAREPTDHS